MSAHHRHIHLLQVKPLVLQDKQSARSTHPQHTRNITMGHDGICPDVGYYHGQAHCMQDHAAHGRQQHTAAKCACDNETMQNVACYGLAACAAPHLQASKFAHLCNEGVGAYNIQRCDTQQLLWVVHSCGTTPSTQAQISRSSSLAMRKLSHSTSTQVLLHHAVCPCKHCTCCTRLLLFGTALNMHTTVPANVCCCWSFSGRCALTGCLQNFTGNRHSGVDRVGDNFDDCLQGSAEGSLTAADRVHMLCCAGFPLHRMQPRGKYAGKYASTAQGCCHKPGQSHHTHHWVSPLGSALQLL